ncbi:VpsF family polysaccharide biosynthesis protein [Tianweitania sp.]|uniref:VpsF family polysaccharide biosynthesis protein n=1 Tax=Tianweitania sp. TaxID=2021634 RepID=UPI0028994DBA|nr:VpsF family polysaccharide biosynthesis protein [Tianweitania sp.]
MAASVTGGIEKSSAADVYQRNAVSLLLFLCAAVVFILRAVVSPQMLNLAVSYSTEGGSFPEKLHIGTYAIFFMLTAVLISRPVLLKGDEVRLFKAILRFTAVILLLVPYLFVTGRAGSSGFVIDSYLVACAAAMIMLSLNRDTRTALGSVMLGMIVVSAIMGIVEAVVQQHFLPYPFREQEFRPIGLSAHPLALGTLCATAIAFVALTPWRLWVKIACILLLFAGAAASGARAALLLAIIEILLLTTILPWRGLTRRQQREAKFIVTLLTVIGGAALIIAFAAGGFLNRFNETIFDENFSARVTVYQVFDFVTWQNILFGMNADDLLAIVNEKLHLPYIESTPVVLGLLFGVPLAVIFSLSFFRFLYQLLRNTPRPAWIGTITFLLAALSNNTLSSKAPELMIVFILLMAYQVNGASDAVNVRRRTLADVA